MTVQDAYYLISTLCLPAGLGLVTWMFVEFRRLGRPPREKNRESPGREGDR
ncbi:MAG: hypothetical protein K2V38_14610 [Gemmataceae bacterium]|nr:hypothetical protein [Gemmataceae bacterium]